MKLSKENVEGLPVPVYQIFSYYFFPGLLSGENSLTVVQLQVPYFWSHTETIVSIDRKNVSQKSLPIVTNAVPSYSF